MALQVGIVMLAFRMDFSQLTTISGDYLVWVGLYVPLTLMAGLGLARLMGLEAALGKLLSSGTAICGGTAIATLAPTVQARSDQLALALAIVFTGLFTASSPAAAQDDTTTKVGAWLADNVPDLMRDSGMPGFSIAVVRDGNRTDGTRGVERENHAAETESGKGGSSGGEPTRMTSTSL